MGNFQSTSYICDVCGTSIYGKKKEIYWINREFSKVPVCENCWMFRYNRTY